jgi:SNF2 family DNA or RNA helicase
VNTSLNCNLNNQTGLVSISWHAIDDDYFIKSFLFNEFNESPINQSQNIDISVGEFLISSSNLIEFWRLNRHLLNEFNISENLRTLYQDIPSYEDAINKKLLLNENEVQAKLDALGFIRKLKNTQVTNVAQISNLPGSADFSVPGAGKTTEALALFLLNKTGPNHKCLIVCPINAFNAWEEEVPGCLGSEFSSVILSGDANNIRKQLDKSGSFFVINYEKIRGNTDILRVISKKLSSPDSIFSIIADESHRMKGVLTSKKMNILAPLCKHKIILTGTPCPQSYDDLESQFRFLYPKETYFDSSEIANKFKPIFVRTTKQELVDLLPKKIEEKIDIKYSGVLKQVWLEITKDVKNRKFNLNTRSDLRDFNKIVIKLIRFCSNPQLVLNEIYKINPDLGDALADEGIGPKMRALISEAVKLINDGEKVLIWSSFPKNIDIICNELELYNANPVKIHGGVAKGNSTNGHLEPGTRRHAIYEFNNNPECMAFVANPAAAGEGISLHKVCRYALYNDRSYNVAHYLQSQDRIHRIGGNINKDVFIKVFSLNGMIDEKISARLNKKTRVMAEFLNDKSIISNFTNYEIDFEKDEKAFLEGDIDNDENFDIEDYQDLLNFLEEN